MPSFPPNPHHQRDGAKDMSLNIDCPKASAPRQDWSAHLTTRTDFGFLVRPAHPGDEPALATFFTHVSPDDLRFRFLSSVNQIAGERLIAMTHVDHELTEHFLALDPDDGAIIASAMLATDPAKVVGEVAISIDSRFKARGIGWALLAHVTRYAKAHGLKRLQSIESRENHAAIDLEREMGFTRKPYPDDPTLVLVEAQL
jgi:acetyltransferase